MEAHWVIVCSLLEKFTVHFDFSAHASEKDARQPWFTEEWLGRELDKQCLKDLKVLSDKLGIDACGEKGEYHTMVIDTPIFKEVIQISKFSKEKKNSLFFMTPTQFFLRPKTNKQTEQGFAANT